MPRYGAGASRVGINTADSAYFQLRPLDPADGAPRRLYVVEVVIAIASAPTTAPSLYLSRSTAVGTSTATLAGQPFDIADTEAARGTLDSTWSANPTFSTTNKMGIGGLGVTAGGVWVWSFRDQPLVIPADATDGLVVANANASGATTGTFVCSMLWDE